MGSKPKRSKLARRRLLALAACIVAFIAAGLLAWQAMPLTQVSTTRYLATAEDHVAMLRRSKGEKQRIVLMGGSGAAFSISAEALTQRLGRPVYNGGIQAGIGLRNLIDLYRPHLDHENDLIVLLPEPEMLADDALYSQTWCDVLYLRKDATRLAKRPRCVPNILWRTWQELQHQFADGVAPDPIYRRSAFNARGDMVAHLEIEREPPDFSDYELPITPPVKLARLIEDVREELHDEGFKVLYVPAAVPLAGCQRAPEQLERMARQLTGLTNATQQSAPDLAPFCLTSEMFFDGAGHLNAKGRLVQTSNVERALRSALNLPITRSNGAR